MTENCDCECKGTSSYTPVRIYNPAGLSSLSYRVGTHGRFKAQMVSEIASESALAKLTTRSDSDLSIALLDSWATIADILAFYQERIANEGFLRTVTERRSVLELARSIGYELRPGVAASTYLAFKMDTSPGSPDSITIEAGTKVQSIPGKDETPQVFETSANIDARKEWSEIKPQLTVRQDAAKALAKGEAIFEGTATKLRAGDGLLFLINGSPAAFRIAKVVEIDAENQQTKVAFDTATVTATTASGFSGDDEVIDTDTNLTRKDLEEVIDAGTWTESALEAKAELEGWSLDVIVNAVNSLAEEDEETEDEIYAFRVKCGAFGHNAPMWKSLPPEQRYKYDPSGTYKDEAGTDVGEVEPPYPHNWENTPVNKNSAGNYYDTTNKNQIYFDNTYPAVQAGSWIALKDLSQLSAFYVSATSEVSLTEFALTGKATGLTLDTSKWFDGATNTVKTTDMVTELETFDFRKTAVYAQPEQLALASMPVDEETVEGEEITLGKMVGWLQEGQPVLVEGELADSGITKREIAVIKNVVHSMADFLTTITLESSLTYIYKRDTVTINANLAKATHGETKEETIGSGDPTQRFQSFALKQSPLTFVSDSSASGTKSTLEIKIDGVTWEEATSFEDLPKSDSAYITRTDNDAKTNVMFGDGTNGRLPPSGYENIKAKYRIGIGTSGLVDADKLTLLMKRPLGVKNVTNPLAATGAADPEELDDARKNAPRTVLTLDRIVSLKDYADFARGFAGVGKATAYEIEYGGGRVMLVAIASTDGETVDEVDDLYTNLEDAIEAYKDPTARFLLRSFNRMAFDVEAKILVSDDREFEDVRQDVKDALKKAFSFDSRDFGQAVTLSEVVSVIQGVDGVEAVDVESLYEHDPDSAAGPTLESIIRAAGIEQDGAVIPSLLLVNEEGITVEEMSG